MSMACGTRTRKRARISRTGVYDYLASEVPGVPAGTPPDSIVKVYRSPDEVFSPEALESFELLPLTILHPSEAVDPSNARYYMHGSTGAPVVADGIHAAVDISLMSEEAIDWYQKGGRQLSAGYDTLLVWESGTTDDGELYDAKQTRIRGNHVALVEAGRAGSAAITDGVKTMDEKLEKELRQQLADAKAEVEKLTKERDGLTGKVAALEAAAVTDEQVNARVKDGIKKAMADKALKDAAFKKTVSFAPSFQMTDETTLRDIQEAGIKARLPEVALEGKSDDHVAGIFETLPNPTTKDETPVSRPAVVSAAGIRAAWSF